jgi:hypothetical protein
VAARRKSERWAVALLRALVVALALPLASSGALPFWAQLAGVEGPHVCHCSLEKHDCVCPKCNPDHEGEMLLTSESLKGRCGDDELAFAGKAICAVLPGASVLAPIAQRSTLFVPESRTVFAVARPPPTPPPRSSSSAV